MELNQYARMQIATADALADNIQRVANTFGKNDPLINFYLKLYYYHKQRAEVSAMLDVMKDSDLRLLESINGDKPK